MPDVKKEIGCLIKIGAFVDRLMQGGNCERYEPADLMCANPAHEGTRFVTKREKKMNDLFSGLIIGRIVHVNIVPRYGEPVVQRAAIVSNVVDETEGVIDVVIFSASTDPPEEFINHITGCPLAANLQYSPKEVNQPYTWHWPSIKK